MAVVAPMASDNVSTTVAVKPAFLMSVRTPKRASFMTCASAREADVFMQAPDTRTFLSRGALTHRRLPGTDGGAALRTFALVNR